MAKEIIVFGKSTYEKLSLMLYIARGLNIITGSSLCVISNNDYYRYDINPYEYLEGIDLFYYRNSSELQQVIGFPYDYKIYDIEDIISSGITEEQLLRSKNLVYSNQDNRVIQYNLKMLSVLKPNAFDVSLVLYGIQDRSKIKQEQLKEIYSDGHKVNQLFVYNYNNTDAVIMIDNGHNQSLKIKSFSRSFKEFLYGLVVSFAELEDDPKVKRKHMKLLERGK